MPLIAYPRELIEMPVADRVTNDTRIGQKARFVSLIHDQAPDGTCSIRIVVRVSLYAKAGDDYGPLLNGPGLSSYDATLSGDSLTLVDAADNPGAILAQQTPGQSPAQWQQVVDSFPQATMLQSDFFLMLRETQDVRIGALIRHHIAQADAMGRFQ